MVEEICRITSRGVDHRPTNFTDTDFALRNIWPCRAEPLPHYWRRLLFWHQLLIQPAASSHWDVFQIHHAWKRPSDETHGTISPVSSAINHCRQSVLRGSTKMNKYLINIRLISWLAAQGHSLHHGSNGVLFWFKPLAFLWFTVQ